MYAMDPAFPEGAPCWADARLPDVEAGKRFYGDLFGWTFDEGAGAERGYYTAAYSQDRAVAAVAPGEAAWTVHLAVRDTYATAERAVTAGGLITAGPVSDGAVATVARLTGPEGAAFGLWQAGSHQGFERTGAPGALCRVDLHTPTPPLSDPFYENVFGYDGYDEYDGYDTEGHGAVRHWRPRGPGAPAPTLARVASDTTPPRFLLHFGATDPDACCAEAVRLGGHVRVAPHDTPYGRRAVLVDDQGAEFGLCTLLEPAGA
ncbi:VOC family protein [Streptomyces sp. NPDC052225]|uniref:VOC family protein n=1 Tax=Streptomyces sp. NPDC052225 TaxID=3154949 RepID=UPI00343CDA55